MVLFEKAGAAGSSTAEGEMHSKVHRLTRKEQADKEHLDLVTKPLLKVSRQVADLNSVVFEVYSCKRDWPLLAMIWQTFEGYKEEMTLVTSMEMEEKERVQEMTARFWDRWLDFLIDFYKDNVTTLTTLQQYTEVLKKEGLGKIMEEVAFIRVRKSFHGAHCKVWINICKGSDSWKLWTTVMKPHLLNEENHQGVRRMPGTEPRGDMERRLQATLDTRKTEKKD